MDENLKPVEESTENTLDTEVEEQYEGIEEELTDTSETKDVEETKEEATETEEETKEVKTYTEDEFNERLDSLLSKKLARKEKKLKKEYDEKYAPLKSLDTIAKKGLGVDSTEEAVKQYKDFYKEQGIDIPDTVANPSLSDDDNSKLGVADAKEIIDAGIDDVEAEMEALVEIGYENLDARGKSVYETLDNHMNRNIDTKVLRELGVEESILENKKFNEFRNKFNPNTPIKEVYELYSATLPKKQTEKMGSMVSVSSKEKKTFYSEADVEKMENSGELDDPEVFALVKESMKKW